MKAPSLPAPTVSGVDLAGGAPKVTPVSTVPPRPVRILFVCLGNICRSPAAEGVLRTLAARAGVGDRVEIASAGTLGYHAGELPDPRMRAAAKARGYVLESRAQAVTLAHLDRFDHVLAMDDDNLRNLLALAETDAQKAKIARFVSHCRAHRADKVPDPYYGGPEGFERVLDLLEDGCRGILATLGPG